MHKALFVQSSVGFLLESMRLRMCSHCSEGFSDVHKNPVARYSASVAGLAALGRQTTENLDESPGFPSTSGGASNLDPGASSSDVRVANGFLRRVRLYLG